MIIDELGRGTGVEEGAALCFAISEHILTTSKPFVFFVTHFQELEHLENIYPNVVNYHFQVKLSFREHSAFVIQSIVPCLNHHFELDLSLLT